MSSSGRARFSSRPWHLWVVALFVFVLYVGGARDYLLILADNTGYIREQFGASGVVYFADYPAGFRIMWTINIICGLTAPIMLIVRSRWAFAAAITAALAQVLLLITTFTFLNRWAMLGAGTSWFDIGVGVVTGLFAWYCWALQKPRPPRIFPSGSGNV